MGYTVGLSLKNKENIKPIYDFFNEHEKFEICVDIVEHDRTDILLPDINISYGPGSFPCEEIFPNTTRKEFDYLLDYITIHYGNSFVDPENNESSPFWLYDSIIQTIRPMSNRGSSFAFMEHNIFRKLTEEECYFYFEEGLEDAIEPHYIEDRSSLVPTIEELKKFLPNFLLFEKEAKLIKN